MMHDPRSDDIALSALAMDRAKAAVPVLPPSCNSWIATSVNGKLYREVWNREDAAMLVLLGWTVRTAFDHLSRLNLPATNTGD